MIYEGLLDSCLCAGHRDHPGQGCAFGTVASDLARSDGKTRAHASAQLQRNFASIAGLLGGCEDARARAILAFSAMAGAVALARVIDDEAQSREVLESVRAQLRALDRGT